MNEEPQVEGFWKECPRCKGTGKEKKDTGIITSKIIEIDCECCGGKKQIFFALMCSHMSLGQIYLEGTNIIRGTHYARCAGIHCHLWDHDHGGGCLERKALLKEVYPEVIT